MRKFITTISFIIEKYDLEYYESDAKYFLNKAKEYGCNSQDFIFHIEPYKKDRYFPLYKVTIGGINADINIHGDYADITDDSQVMGKGYTIYFNNMLK